MPLPEFLRLKRITSEQDIIFQELNIGNEAVRRRISDSLRIDSSTKPTEQQINQFLERQKRNYFGKIARSYLSSLKLYIEGDLVNNKNKLSREISRHALVTAAVSAILADIFKMSSPNKNNLISAALVHDFNFEKEEELVNAFGLKGLNLSVQERIQKLEERDFPPKMISLVEEEDLIRFGQFQPEKTSLDNRLLHFAGLIVKGTDIVSIDEKIMSMEMNQYFIKINNLFRTNGEVTFFNKEREFGHKIQGEVAKKVGLSQDLYVPKLIKYELIKRVSETI